MSRVTVEIIKLFEVAGIYGGKEVMNSDFYPDAIEREGAICAR